MKCHRMMFLFALLFIVNPAAAQSTIGIRGYGAFGSTTFAATDTFEAVAGATRRTNVGGGVQVTNIWRGIFAEVGLSQVSMNGQRVFVHSGQVFELGVPLAVTMRPVEVAAGWRLSRGRISPFVGAGLSYLTYEETSSFANTGENVNESGTGPLALGGVDVQVWRFLYLGGEFRYRHVDGILGGGGVSSEFGENNAGGISVGLRITVGR